MATTKRNHAPIAGRYTELRRMLEDRRRELTHDVRGRIRGVRAQAAGDHDVLDEGDTSAADIEEDIELALIEMQSETLNKIADALRKLDDGSYGRCLECGAEITEARLRALPFALRCTSCEEVRETSGQRVFGKGRLSFPLLSDLPK